MQTPITEAKSGVEMVLRREARKAPSGRVPVILSIAVALLSGVLFGFGLRASMAEAECGHSSCAVRVPPQLVLRPLTAHGECDGPPRIYLPSYQLPTHEQAPVSSPPVPDQHRGTDEAKGPAPAPAPAALD